MYTTSKCVSVAVEVQAIDRPLILDPAFIFSYQSLGKTMAGRTGRARGGSGSRGRGRSRSARGDGRGKKFMALAAASRAMKGKSVAPAGAGKAMKGVPGNLRAGGQRGPLVRGGVSKAAGRGSSSDAIASADSQRGLVADHGRKGGTGRAHSEGSAGRAKPPNDGSDMEGSERESHWYDSSKDVGVFARMVPRVGNIVRFYPLSSKGDACELWAEGIVEQCDDINKKGLLTAMKWTRSEDAKRDDWGVDFMKGAKNEETGFIHFCRGHCCDLLPQAQTVHCNEWQFIENNLLWDGDATPVRDPKSTHETSEKGAGVTLFGGKPLRSKEGREGSLMGRVDDLRSKFLRKKEPEASTRSDDREGVERGPHRLPLPRPSADSGQRPRGDRSKGGTSAPGSNFRDQLVQRIEKTQRSGASEKLKPLRKESRKDAKVRREDDSSGSDESQVFREAPSILRSSPILKIAELQGGELLRNGVTLMRRALSARQGGGNSADSSEGAHLEDLQGVATAYLTTALAPSLAAESKPLSQGCEREMRTIAESIDAIMAGDVLRAGDVLMQRFRSCETRARDGSWSLGQHMELIPNSRVSSVPEGMRRQIIAEENQHRKLSKGSGKWKGNG